MWRVLERKGRQLYLSDGSGESKWVRKKEAEKIQEYGSFEQYFLSLDMVGPPEIWCPNLL